MTLEQTVSELLKLATGSAERYRQQAEQAIREYLRGGGARHELRDAFHAVSPGTDRSDAIAELIETVV